MTSSFPEDLDNFTNPVSSDALGQPPHSAQHSNLNDAVEALEAKVGIDNSQDVNSLDYKVAALQNDLGNTLDDFIPVGDLGQPDGPAQLGADGHLLLESSIDYTGLTTLVSSTSATTVYEWDISLYTTMEYIMQIKQGQKYRSSKIMILTDESSIIHTEYAIIQIGSDIAGLSIDASISTGNGILSVQVSDANITNAQVKVIRSAIA